MKLSRVISAAAAAAMIISAVSCAKSVQQPDSGDIHPETIQQPTTEPAPAMYGQTITWLADYDLNPAPGEERPVALAIFEDFYGGKVNFVYTSQADKFAVLDHKLASGEEVDLFAYEPDVFPDGVDRRFQPLDPYFETLGMDEELWDGMREVMGSFEYGGSHYVVPYSLSDPVVVTYSRKLIKEEKLDDPYELWQKGEWDWDAMMKLMEKFVAPEEEPDEKEPESEEKKKRKERRKAQRFGISGSIGQALLQSTGHGIVEYENGKLVSRLDSPEITKAGQLMEQLVQSKLYRSDDLMNYPADDSTLFFVMEDWALGESNAQNPDSDLMVVPFPRMTGAKEDYLTCRFNAKLLVKGSTKGDAAAAYIKCERIAATDERYRKAAKEEALVTKLRAPGVLRYCMKGEQYDAIQSFLDPAKITPVVDLGYGLGKRMNGGTGLALENRGVMDRLDNVLFEGSSSIPDWAALRDSCKPVIDEEIKNHNG